jgi:Fe-S cluster biogenesis protein NfuA
MVAQQTVESALAVLRPGLAADGFDLRVGDVDGGVVKVVLEAKPAACLDCLVPDEMMTQMIADAIRREDPSLDRVDLVKEGFENLSDH